MKLISFIFRHFIPIALLAGVAVIIFSAATPVTSSRIEPIGVDLLSSPPLTEGAVEQQLNAIQNSGSEYVRIEVNWTLIETSQDLYNWSNAMPLDLFITSASARGLKCVAVLTGFPLYLSSSGTALDQKTVGERWEKFIQAAMEHFGDRVDYWQIGDQINSSLSSRSLSQADPAFYAKMLRSASKIIKKANPNDQVWMGSLVSATAVNCAVNPLTFLLEINGANAWKSADIITYQPQRGATTPETPSTATISPACSSAMTENYTSLSTEVLSVQDLARQLGGKTVYITGLSWSLGDLQSLQGGRSIDLNTLQSDLLVRASVILTGANSIPVVFWQIDPVNQPSSMTTMTNLNTSLDNSQPLGQIQGQTGVVHEFRFQKGARVNVLAWRSLDGDSPQPVSFSGLATGSMLAYSTDVATLDQTSGTPIDVDASGNTIIMLNERPVILVGKTGGWDSQIKAMASDQLDSWRISIHQAMSKGLNRLKAALFQWLEDLFTSAKDSAVDWGEEKIKEFLN